MCAADGPYSDSTVPHLVSCMCCLQEAGAAAVRNWDAEVPGVLPVILHPPFSGLSLFLHWSIFYSQAQQAASAQQEFLARLQRVLLHFFQCEYIRGICRSLLRINRIKGT